IIGSIIQIAASAICVAATLGACTPFVPLVAAGAAAFVAGVTSGNLGAALRAGVIAGATALAFNAVGTATAQVAETAGSTAGRLFNVAGHALVGCGQAMASGEKCGPSRKDSIGILRDHPDGGIPTVLC